MTDEERINEALTKVAAAGLILKWTYSHYSDELTVVIQLPDEQPTDNGGESRE